ncbi:putative phage abortive infection protein [Acinetobacter bereziniae]|uniref:putative phage abortive infection protein n=1 Tax=Acinetobacter bereziniae TaxID=106648 RepID=UPI00124F4669|nr:putative phage abortive infection protein [Acinetobacter bereziniae]
MKYLWGIGALILLLIWLFFPSIFNWWAVHVWNLSGSNLDRLGPLGDIYGSLNTLISSIALCAVAYSTWLQTTSLRETRDANGKQMKFAEQVHDEQIKESKSATFTTKFYSLLEYKDAKLKHLIFTIEAKNESVKGNRSIGGLELMEELSATFYHDILKNQPKAYDNLTIKDLENELTNEFQKHVSNSISSLISYFYIHCEIVKLISDSDITNSEKEFFQNVLQSSMFQTEQIVLFWISPIYKFTPILKNGFVFNQIGFRDHLQFYALKHYDSSFFKHDAWQDFFKENAEKRSPA